MPSKVLNANAFMNYTADVCTPPWLLDNTKKPEVELPESHQVWVWMNGPGLPHWEIRGTGAIF